jgi:hypothetical protein
MGELEDAAGLAGSVLDFVLPQLKAPRDEYYRLRHEITSMFLSASKTLFNFTIQECDKVSPLAAELHSYALRLAAWPDMVPRRYFPLLRLFSGVRSRKQLDIGWHSLVLVSNLARTRKKGDYDALKVMIDAAVRAQQSLDLNLGM